MLTATTIAVLLPSLLLAGVDTTADQQRCAVVDSIGRCLVSAVDPGRAGSRARKPDRLPDGSRSQQPGRESDRGPTSAPPPPPADVLPIGSGWAQGSTDDLDRRLAELEAGQRRDDAPPTPEVLALRAVRQLDLPAPTVRTSGENGGAVVGVPLWLWVDDDGAFAGSRSATAAAGVAQVTAEAQFSGLEWTMGPPGAVVRCDGPGTPWTGQAGPSPDCGYTYRERSLVERTGGTGRWPVVVAAIWTVTWSGSSAGVPVTGEQVVRVPTSTTLSIGEVQVLVVGDGS